MTETTTDQKAIADQSFFAQAKLVFGRYSEFILPILVLLVLTVMLVPIPPWLLDVSLALSLGLAVMILVTVIMMHNFQDFTGFPSILLIITMLRLALNVASTRLILSEGHVGPAAAGKVIQSFGNVIVSGNYVIGLIVFLVLVIINFVVITRGSGRIAEVAARFTLDALPGKQMAIDADLSSGLIDEDEARGKRKSLDEQSTFYGAMDGASKFVRGDAIAGLLITFINIVGGLLIGILQKGMSFSQAAENYTILTVGDGLVTQVPSLLVSIAAGMLVTKSSADQSTDKILAGQLSKLPNSWWIVAGSLLIFALLPGMPAWPFFLLATGAATIAFFLTRGKKLREDLDKLAESSLKDEAEKKSKPINEVLEMDLIRLEIGYGLLPMVNNENENQLPAQIKGLRKQFAQEYGFILPAVRIQDNLQLPANTYLIYIKEIEIVRAEVVPNMILVMDPKGEPIHDLSGMQAKEPIFGLDAKWVQENMQEEAQFKGYTVVTPSTVITTHLSEVIKDTMPELLTYAETRKLLDQLSDNQKKLIEDIVPSVISFSGIHNILRNLLQERVSIRDLNSIVEAIASAANTTQNIKILTEIARSRLSRQLCFDNRNADGVLELAVLSPALEEKFGSALVGDGEEKQLALSPSNVQSFIQAIHQFFQNKAKLGQTPVLLVSPSIRPYVRSLIERFRPQTVVMSQNEIHPKAKLVTVGTVE